MCDEIGLSNGDTDFGDDDTDLLYSNGHFLGNSPIGKFNTIFLHKKSISIHDILTENEIQEFFFYFSLIVWGSKIHDS